MDTDLTDEVRTVMASTFGVSEDDIPDDVEQGTVEYWTSLYHLALVVALEERFDASFTVDEIPEMTSLEKIVAVLRSHG